MIYFLLFLFLNTLKNFDILNFVKFNYIIYVNVINLHYLIFITIKIKNSEIFYSILLLLIVFWKENKNLLLIFTWS